MTQEKSFKSKAWEFFQSLGKTFMFPVSLLAFMGLLLGIGSSVTSPSTIKSFPFLGGELTQLTFGFIAMVGGFAFTYLPLMFSSLAFVDKISLNARNIYRLAIPLFVGIFLINPPAVFISDLPVLLRPMLGNGMLVAILLAVLSESLVRWDKVK